MDGSKHQPKAPSAGESRIRTSGTTKDAIVIANSEKVPELWLPRTRPVWENEHCSIAIFEAAVLMMPGQLFRSNTTILTGT